MGGWWNVSVDAVIYYGICLHFTYQLKPLENITLNLKPSSTVEDIM